MPDAKLRAGETAHRMRARLLVAIAAAYWLARSITRPMRLLTDAARRFGTGDLTARTEVSGGGAVGILGNTFNQMAKEIEQREEELKTLDRLKSEFVSSVSHELRTPLTTIKTLTRVLQSDKISQDERAEFLETIAEECDRQIDFVQTLLDLSRIESGAYKISLAPQDVVQILAEIVKAHAKAATTRRLNLAFTPPPKNLPRALTDAEALRRIVSSLVENAMKYTPENGFIEIFAGVKNNRIAIEIADSGCGIRAEDLPRIFEKFYRGQPLAAESASDIDDNFLGANECGSTNEVAGIGLGLYLVRNLVEQIGGEIIAESPFKTKKTGTKFTLFLPIDADDETKN